MAGSPQRADPGAVRRHRERAGRALGRAGTLAQHSLQAFFADRCGQLAAGISYYALLSLFPAAIFLAAVFGFAVGDENARGKVVDFLFDELPVSEGEGRRDLENVVEGVTRNTGALGIAGLVGVMISASALMGAIRNSVAIIWESERQRPPLRGKALDLLLVLGLGLLITLSLAATLIQGFAIDLSQDLGTPGRLVADALDLFGFLIPPALALVAFTALLWIVPHPRPALRDIWPGVIVATAGYELAKRGFALYIENFADYSAVYGSLGAVITFLVFIYIAALVFLLGGEFAALWPRVRAGAFDDGDDDGEPLGRRVVVFLRGLVVERRGGRSEPSREPGGHGESAGRGDAARQ